MTISFSIYSSILWLGFLQAIIYFFLLAIRSWRQSRLSDLLLGLLLIQAGLLLLPYMLGFMGIGIMWNELLFFPTEPGLLIGPTIFAYLLSQTNQEFKLERKHLLHVIPFGLYATYHLIIFVQGSEFVQNWLSEVHLSYVDTVERIGILVSNISYLFFSFRHYNQYRKWIETEFSNPEDVRLDWYRIYLIVVASGIALSWIFNLVQMAGHNLSYTQSWWEYAGIVLLIYILSINGYHQTQTVYLYFPREEEGSSEESEQNTSIPEQELEEKKQELTRLMEQKQIFLQPQLSLREVGTMMGLPKSILSQVINQGFNKNFSQFVNEYRVSHFQEMVREPKNQHLSLLAIALDSGFNSKATFNRVFKATTGMSPRAFTEQEAVPA